MQPRFVGRLGIADAVTVGNATLGFAATVLAAVEPPLAARLVLLAAIADGLDGVLARRYGGSRAGPYLDSLADVASFAVAPAVLVVAVVHAELGLPLDPATVPTAGTLLVGGVFVAAAVVRLGLYTVQDADAHHTEGIPSTLAATLLGAAVLAGVTRPAVVSGAAVVLAVLMVSTFRYPDLLARDALLMGIVHALAVLVPTALDRAFPFALLTLGIAYLCFGPWCYWRDGFAIGRPRSNRG